jgi:D-alanyl-D-alanine carboxypeptidase
MSVFSRRDFLSGMVAAGVLGAAARFDGAWANEDRSFDQAMQMGLSRALDQAFTQVKAPGIIAGVTRGEQLWSSLRGTTAWDGGQPVTLDLTTRVGSVTKTMTGTVILQLVDDGLLSLDDRMSRWFPGISGADKITLEMLGNMSSGLNSYTLDEKWQAEYFGNPARVWDPEQLVQSGAGLPRVFEPGNGFLYCNTNLVALGLIAEKTMDLPLGEIFERRLFKPLGMLSSGYPAGTELPQPYWSGYTLQGTDGDKPVDATAWSPTFGAGAGQATSNFHDLLIWARALGRGTLLKPATQQRRLVMNPYSEKSGRGYLFALGQDHGWLAHSGELPGYNTQVAYLPSEDTSIVVMANSDIPSADGVGPAVKVFRSLAATLTPNHIPGG